MTQLGAYLRLIAGGTIAVPARTFPLARITEAWAAAEDGGDRVVVLGE